MQQLIKRQGNIFHSEQDSVVAVDISQPWQVGSISQDQSCKWTLRAGDWSFRAKHSNSWRMPHCLSQLCPGVHLERFSPEHQCWSYSQE